MGMSQTQKVEEDLHAALPGDLFLPPSGGICLINNLPPELLSRIFEVGSEDDGVEDEDDVAQANVWENFFSRLDSKGANEQSKQSHDDGVKMKEESCDEDREPDEEETVGQVDSDASDSTSSRPPFAIVVSQVCHHWRDVALSTPSLWTAILVVPQARPPYKPVSTLLERSKDHPIDICVNCKPDDEEEYATELPSDTDLRFLFAMLVPHIHRWRTMEVTVSEYRHMYVFLSVVSDPSVPAASQLTALELYHLDDAEEFDNFGYPSMSKHLTLFGGSAPLLTKLILWGVHVDWSQPWIVSAPKLKVLQLAFQTEDVLPSWAQFTSILRSAPSLENLSLRQFGPSGDPSGWFMLPTVGSLPDVNAPIQLLQVTDFDFAFHSQARAIALIKKLHLPALKNLLLDFDNGDYTDFVHELVGPATSSSPSEEQPGSLLSKLETIQISGLPCRYECISALYGELQNVASLNISLSHLPPSFLDILGNACTLPGRGDIWLPRLVTLYVSGVSGKSLRKVVQKRKDAGVPLSSLYVEQSSDVLVSDADWFRENVDRFEFFEGSDDEDEDYEDEDEDEDEDDFLYEADDFSDDDDDDDDDDE